MSTSKTGRSWLEMNPAHFDASLLPRKHQSAPEGLFDLADVATPKPRKSSAPTPELDGQGDLLSLLGE